VLLRVVLIAAALAILPACSHSGKKSVAPLPTTSTTAPAPQFKVQVTSADLQSMKAEGAKLPDDVRKAVVATLDAYVGKAMVDPLNSGQAAVGLDSVFTADGLAKLVPGSSDRAALVDDTRPAPGAVAPEREQVALTALTAPDGTVVVVDARVDLSLVFTMPTGRLRIARVGDLVLVPANGGWRIDSYDMQSKHDTIPPPPAPTTTTTRKKK